MRRFLPLHWDATLPFFLQAVAIACASLSANRALWLAALSLNAGINLWGWQRAFGLRRRIQDTPTSRIASAAQGYVELIGTGLPLADSELLTPHSHLPCLWYRYTVERREDRQWRTIGGGESDLPFLLDDGSGRCELDPSGAEIFTTHHETRVEGDIRYRESLLLKGNRLYVLGEFTTDSHTQRTLDRRGDIGDLLSAWKQDSAALQQRFDLDGNGEIEGREWQLARLAAAREVDRQHQALRAQPPIHRLRKPAAGLPYLITNQPPQHLGRRYAWLTALHLLLLVAMLVGLGWIGKQEA